ncbi:MAG: DUF4124 domain-containing protein [Pseudomonadota bacterium]
MRLSALLLALLPAFLSGGVAAQATLNKCIDAAGRVTYSNLPCRGAREVKQVEIDPPPPKPAMPPTPAAAPTPTPQPTVPSAGAAGAPPAPPARTPAVAPAAATPRLSAPAKPSRPAATTTPRNCDALTEQLGRVLDQMDASRSKGVTPQQLDAWTREVETLERRKREAGCF